MANPKRSAAKPKPKAAPDNPGVGGSAAAKPSKSSKVPKEKAIKVNTRGPFVVGAREEEMELIQRETHSCGGGFEIEIEEVRPATDTAGPTDVLKTLCVECGAHVDFLFDISSFYDDKESEFEVKAPGADEAPEGEDDEGGWLS